MPRSAVPFPSAIIVAVVAALAIPGARPMAAQTVAQAETFGTAGTAGAPSASGAAETLGSPTAAGAQPGVAAAERIGTPTSADATYPVAARDLERGEVLTAEDIAHVAVPEGEAAPEDAPESLVGWTTRRVIAAGDPLREPAVSPPDLVRAGEPVHAVYQGWTIVLRVAGTAAGSGAMGDRVLVRVDARRRLQGVVIGPALVLLDSNESR